MSKASGAFSRPLAATLAVAATMLFAAPAAADSVVELRPVSDESHGWTPVGASAAWEALDDNVAAGQTVPRTDLITAKSGSRVAAVNLAAPGVPAGETPATLSANYFAKTGRRTKVRVQLRSAGGVLSKTKVKPKSHAKWRSLSANGLADVDLNSLTLRFKVSRKRRAQVRAAYVHVETTAEAPAAAADVSVFGPNTNIRPDRATPAGGSNRAELVAAQNEFESFQVVTEATDTPIQGLQVELAGALHGPLGATIGAEDVTVYREAYYKVSAAEGKPRSSRKGDEGLWADALIPERDPYYGENRSAFPVDVPAGEKVTAWVDVFAPQGTAPGAYTGEIRVSDANGEIAKVPVELQVSGFAMPSTSTLKSAFLMTPPGYFPCRAHRATDWCYADDEANWKLDYLYARAALENRVTIPNATPGAFDQGPNSEYFDQYMLPLINGTDSGGIDGTLAPRLQGAKLTTITAMWQCVTNPSCFQAWRDKAQQEGFASRFFAYVCDEPVKQDTPEYWNDWGDCTQNSRQAKAAWPGVKTLVTSWIQDANSAEAGGWTDLQRDVDIMGVPVNRMDNRPDNPQAGDQTAAYSSFLSGSGNEAWMYTACPQFSCDEQESSYFDGWANYVIDQPGSQARAMGWLSYLYGTTGELYHNTTLKLDTAWDNQYAWGGNGDGTLFYPGSPSGYGGAPAIGGQHDIPIESIRLKRIRDGREDYEVLHALDSTGQASEATAALTSLLGSTNSAMYSTDVTQGAIDTTRCTLMTALDPSVATACR